MEKEILNQLEVWFQNDEHQEIVDLIKALPKEDLNYNLIGQLGRAYNNLEQYDLALEVLSSVANLGSDDALWNFRMAYSYFYKNDYQEALPFLERCLELGDEEENTRLLYQWCQNELAENNINLEFEELIIDPNIEYIRLLKTENFISVLFLIEQEKVLKIAENMEKINQKAYMNGYNWEAFLNFYLAKYHPVVLEKMDSDPEAGMYVAHYEPSAVNETKAKMLAKIMIELVENEEKLYSLVKEYASEIEWD